MAVLGAAAYAEGDPETVQRSLDAALAAGVNHLDIAPRYGRAEALVGPLLPARRPRLFVASKTTRHHPDGVRAQLETSLERLGCDHFDLYQLHAVTDLDEIDRRAGAVQAVLEARGQGLCRFAGITGHGLGAPAAHLAALRRYDLDTVMFPLNPRLWADPSYRADAEALLEHAAAHDVGVMVIKAVAARPWGERPRSAATWYEPYADEEGVRRGVAFALSTPGVHALCTPGDVALLAATVQAVANWRPMTGAERDAAVAACAAEPHIFPMPVA